jgi:dTDP-4-amino-4,6-dideoxygalactose transaminase
VVPLIDLSRRLISNSDSFHAVVQGILTSGNVLLAQQTEMFEESFASFAGARYGVAVSSGASALQLSLAALGIGEGDEVIVPAMTAVPTASAVCAVGARPVANIERLMNLGVKVVEDCAQSHGATRGLTGSVGAYSFYPTKNLGGIGDGGMVVTDDPDVADRVRRLRVHGQSEQYVHIEVSQNHRMSEIEAAWLNVVLPQLVSGNERRRKIAEQYRLANASIRWQKYDANHVYHLAAARIPDREAFRQQLLSRGISTGVHYPLALTQQPALQPFVTGTCPVAERWASECVSLPCFPELTDDEINEVCHALAESSQ